MPTKMEQNESPLVLDISTARFAPMRRLLSGEDEDFLVRQGFRREAERLRAEHRKLYFRFVTMLERDFNRVHEARKAAMAENWDFESLMRERWTALYCVSLMRVAGMMHWVHVPQAGKIAQAYADRIQSFISTATRQPAT